MRSYSIIVSVIVMQLYCNGGVSSSDDRQSQRISRETDGVVGADNDRSDAYDGGLRRTVNTYHHVSDGTSSSSSADGGGGWIIGGSRRRASAGAHKYMHQDKVAFAGETDDKRREPTDDKLQQQWPAVVGSEGASSLSEVQVVVHQPHHNSVTDGDQQQLSSDAASKWYSKRLSYATKTSPVASSATVVPPLPSSLSLQPQPDAAGSNAVLLAEVLGQKSGFNTTAGKGGYYGGQTVTGSKGFQNDLMDMLGKSMWSRPRLSAGLFYIRFNSC